MANKYGINVADVYKNIDAMESNRLINKGRVLQNTAQGTQNKLSAIKLSEVERDISKRPEREANERGKQNRLRLLREQSAAGDVEAQQQLLSIDPEGGAQFIDAVSKMDDRKIEETKRNIEMIGRASSNVLEGKTEQERAQRYNTLLSNLPPEITKNMPKEYNQDFVDWSLAKAIPMDEILKNPQSIQFGNKDLLYQKGKRIDSAKRPEKKTGAGGGAGLGGGLKSADESLMYRQSVELLGGIFDEAGNITNLDPTVRGKIQGIAAEAVKEFQTKGSISRTQAVKNAARKYGLSVPEGGGSSRYNEGQLAKNPDGDVIIFTNGQWVKK